VDEARQADALLTEEGQELVNSLCPYEPAKAMALGENARRDHPAELVAAAMTQARLRTKALDRLGPQAADLWFTAAGLEQATRPEVASRRAAHLVAAGAKKVADLGCGLGFDAIAFAQAGLAVLAVEHDPVIAKFARANMDALHLSDRVSVMSADATAIDPPAHGCDAVFVDPARREAGRRIKDPQKWSPSWSKALALATSTPIGCLKVAPGIDHELPPTGSTTEWISSGGTLVEACVWLGAAADAGINRRAVVLPAAMSLDDSQLGAAVAVGELGGFLLEPDDAVIRSGLVAVVSEQVGGRLIDADIAYITCDGRPPASPLYAAFEVIEAMPFSLKSLRARVHALGIGRVEVKKRGSALDPELLRKQLRLDAKAARAAVILLTRIGRNPFAVIATRLP